MTAKELRQKFLNFFESREHVIIPSASLIPENDPTVLFTTAGMHPLVPYLMGEKHPTGQRLVNHQKCLRTTDIDEVGDATHHTFFEMLGNWSLGDPKSPDGIGRGYFKKESIEWSWEFLTSPQWLGLDKSRLATSVFIGSETMPLDQESFNTWRILGVPEKRIAKLSEADNWWGLAEGGPCGPDTEIFYWTGQENLPEAFDPTDKKWVEIWNNVFMQFNKKKDGSYESLAQKNVDTGMGLERILAVINGLGDNYQTELFWPIIDKIGELSGKHYGESAEITRSMRIIADHLKAAVLIMGDDGGIAPSNTDRGYVVRRLIRRAIRLGKQLGIKQDFWTTDVAEVIIDIYRETYQELEKNQQFIIDQLHTEEAKFKLTLENGLREFEKIIEKLPTRETIDGEKAFHLYDTYGFPLELTRELASERGLVIDEGGFKEASQKHQDLSRTASAGMFKGGLSEASGETAKLHTATHLLLAALRQVLGDQVFQKGSNITPERLRLDFSHAEKITPEQIKQVEDMVNQKITEKLDIKWEEMSLEEAKQRGAMGVFEAKYGERVKVYTIFNAQTGEVFSQEICGGPHINNTSGLGHFKILKEEASSAGVRRIKAVC